MIYALHWEGEPISSLMSWLGQFLNEVMKACIWQWHDSIHQEQNFDINEPFMTSNKLSTLFGSLEFERNRIPNQADR